MKTILIIEDNIDIRESCIEILELSGYTVLQADNGKSGFDLALKHKPDLILCDIMMPEMDGYGVLYLLNKNDETADIPFIFLTAKTDRIDFRKGMEMGADDYLTKPFDDMDLLHAVETRINKHLRQKTYHGSAFETLEKLTSATGKGMDELKALINGRKVKQLKKKQILYYEGDSLSGLYMILNGNIKTMKIAEDGRQFITGLYGPDDYIGLDTLLLEEAFAETAEAVEDTSLYLLPKDQVLNLLNKYPEISTQFIKILSNNIHEKEEQLLELAYHSVRKRLARVLLRLNKKVKQADQIIVSREELAALAGIAVETVSRTLTDFKFEGLLEKNGNQIQLLNTEKLVKMKN
ncbi:CRP-like cAMP-binding protein/ActR/RegA family two-component response regulator [Pedobacter africanus]|uniref:CRP-like cAMP-binding protein/ActR/RegA family two-component response regulator n=1 Tax=Pedobacter africanus TaxID=151894 RepID=A0ACC6KUI9_9SPHI|nr:response regulator [Pedobacter africanus]MDR6782778.1 CRP-like cAMP-binding protein/ActR/RegA family two-component response regulator [Pedobacter africanus]